MGMMKLFSSAFWSRYSADYMLVNWLFLRGLALIYIAAFASMAVQIDGLVGPNGILPAIDNPALTELFSAGRKNALLPAVYNFLFSDTGLRSVCYAGLASACMLLCNVLARLSLCLCYLLYWLIVQAGQVFTRFQWDYFLLEIGFLAIFLTWGSPVVILMYRWLLARFMFMGGVVKIASGDPTWANLTALQYHYETQPLPTPLAFYAHQLPAWLQQLCAGGVFFIELIVPFCVFLGRPYRLVACASFVLLQGAIMLTGNYNFFNLSAILLCLFLLEDRDVGKVMPDRLINGIQQKQCVTGKLAHSVAAAWAAVVLLVCGGYIWLYHVRIPLAQPLQQLLRSTATLGLVNNYGPFAVMTTVRDEIIVQGSNDGVYWHDYAFRFKPGNPDGALRWNIPHQPRLDWQMWFAALQTARQVSWFDDFLNRLLKGSPQVLALLKDNPFPDAPPRFVRAMRYRYVFSSLPQRHTSGTIWQRSDGRVYRSAKSLKSGQ